MKRLKFYRHMRKEKASISVFNRSTAMLLATSMLATTFIASGFSVYGVASSEESVATANDNSDIASPNIYADAVTDNDFGAGIYAATATYYDYMSDKEIDGTYLNPLQAGTGYNGSSDDWYPFYMFNRLIYKEVAVPNSSWTYPLYFGNFCNTGGSYKFSGNTSDHSGDFWNATNDYNVTRFNYAVNNSNKDYAYDKKKIESKGIPNVDTAVQGLVSDKLGENGELMAADGTTVMPYFDNEFLSKKYSFDGSNVTQDDNGKRVAQIYKSYFPFVETTTAHYGTKISKYSFDSTNAKDNVYFSWENGKPKTVHYGNGSDYGVQDGLKYFMYNTESGYGIFPFNNSTSHTENNPGNKNLDYGFGVKIELDFRVPKDGLLPNGEAVKFNFSGDDDIWVYISEEQDDNARSVGTMAKSELVLDLGGDHKMASGSIDFSTMKATVASAATMNSDGSVKDLGQKVTTFNNGEHLDKNKTYHMTIFYMERGTIESNFKADFTFAPLDNILTTNKILNTEDVNSGLKNVIADNDFTISNSAKTNGSSQYEPLNEKAYTYDIIKADGSVESGDAVTVNNKYSIVDKETARFTNITETGDYLKVAEDKSGSKILYDTIYSITDVANQKAIATQKAGDTAEFHFINSVNEKKLTNYNVEFVNTPKLSDLVVNKTVCDDKGEFFTTDEADYFDFTILLDVGEEGGSQAYNLEYDLYDEDGNFVDTLTADDGRFTLGSQQKAIFTNIPVGADYTITEDSNAEYETHIGSVDGERNRTVSGTVSESTAKNEFEYYNVKINYEDTQITLNAEKRLNDENMESDYRTNIFQFDLTEYQLSGGKLVNGKLKDTATNYGSEITFNISYPHEVIPTEPPVTTQPTTAPAANTVYFKPTSEWKQANAWFAIYLYNSTTDNTWYKLNEIGSSGVYQATISDKSWSNAIFVRMNAKDTSTLSWDNKWNQTADLKFKDGGNCFTANSGWDDIGGTWSNYSSARAYSLEPNEIYVSDMNTYDNAGTANTAKKYYYTISEKALSDKSYTYDSTVYYVVVTVQNNEATAKYYESELDAVLGINALGGGEIPAFDNYNTAKITVKKSNQAGNNISDTYFALVKVIDEEALDTAEAYENIVAVIESGEYSSAYMTGSTNSKGQIIFDNLDIHQNSDGMFDENGRYIEEYDVETNQTYCLLEYKPSTGYNPNYTIKYVTFPVADKYSITFDYVDGVLIVPEASGTGTSKWLFAGLSIIFASTILSGAYILCSEERRRKLAGFFKNKDYDYYNMH